MKKKIILLSTVLILIILPACSQQERTIPRLKKGELQKIESFDQFEEFTSYRIQEGKFYFTAMPNGYLGYYSFDLATREIKLLFDRIEQFLSFIPLDDERAVYVDEELTLFHRQGEKDIKLDEHITGLNNPNILASPDGKGILYTKGNGADSALYQYMFDDKSGSPKKLVDKLEEEAFNTFHFTTQWSNNSHYFIYYNQQVYDNNGKLVDTLNGTTSKWSPDDQYIAFVKMPGNKNLNEITIGDWRTYVGKELVLFNVKDRSRTILFRDEEGFIDPIESIQWSKDGSRVAISHGEIVMTQDYFEKMNYDKILVYNLKNESEMVVEPMAYNFYEFVFNNYIYGNNLGVKEALELVNIETQQREKYDEAVILNSKDMYFITHQDKAYMVDGKLLLELNDEGEKKQLLEFPFEVFSLYFDKNSETMVVINRAGELYLLKV